MFLTNIYVQKALSPEFFGAANVRDFVNYAIAVTFLFHDITMNFFKLPFFALNLA